MDLGLAGRRAIITGGTRGIGRRTAEALADEGCSVGLCARQNSDVEETVSGLEARGISAFGRAVDVADASALTAWVTDAASALGGLDVVVANVSSMGYGEGEEAWRASFEIDIMHTVRMTEAALPHLRESDAGAIVVVSTVAAIETGPLEGAYGTLKAALIRYAAGMASVLAPEGIRVNAVSPGTIYIEDGFWGGMSRDNPEMFAQAMSWNPMGRMGTPDEVARAIAFLASPAASFITGANLIVDGGLTRGVQF